MRQLPLLYTVAMAVLRGQTSNANECTTTTVVALTILLYRSVDIRGFNS